MEIRRPAPNECDSVRALVQTVGDEVYGGTWASPPLPIDEEDWSRAWLAVSASKIVGMVLTHEEWVSDLWGLREHRNRGVGPTSGPCASTIGWAGELRGSSSTRHCPSTC